MSQRKSLFLQVTSASPHWVRRAMEHIRAFHNSPAEGDYIYNLVLQDVAYLDGRLRTDVLDEVVPYLPGGDKPTFDNVFIGSVDLPYPTGSKYREGFLDEAFRWENILCSEAAALAFRARYPRVEHHWYITYEADLWQFREPAVRGGFEALAIELIRRWNRIRPGLAVLWSPAFWMPYRLTTALQRRGLSTQLKRLFTMVRSYTGQGITWLHFQDFVGGSSNWANPTYPSDAVKWYRWLQGVYNFASLRLNVEMFRWATGGGLVPASPAELAERQRYYASRGIPMGASWELRYWLDNHQELA